MTAGGDTARVEGRFLTDQPQEGVSRWRVREGDAVYVWRAVCVAFFLVVGAVFPVVDFRLGLISVVASWVALVWSGAVVLASQGVRRSRYPRVRQSLEVRRPAENEGGYREAPVQTTLLVDGRSFAASDLVGVVVALSRGTRSAGRGRRVPSLRYAPSVVFPDVVYELDDFEEGDVAYAHAMADGVASAVTGHPGRAPVFEATGLDQSPVVLVPRILVAMVLWFGFVTEFGFAGARPYAFGYFVVVLAADFVFGRLAVRAYARARSVRATHLIEVVRRSSGAQARRHHDPRRITGREGGEEP